MTAKLYFIFSFLWVIQEGCAMQEFSATDSASVHRFHTVQRASCSQKKLLELVTDFARYPTIFPIFHKFNPKGTVSGSMPQTLLADVEIRYGILFRSSYQVAINILSPDEIHLKATPDSLKKSALKTLNQYWRFKEDTDPSRGTEVEFFIELELQNTIFNKMAGPYFKSVMEQGLKDCLTLVKAL